MRKTLFIILFLSFQIINAQEKAYYISNLQDADLFCINLDSNIIEKTLSFKDTISVVNMNKQTKLSYLNPISTNNIETQRVSKWGVNKNWIDSIKVEDKWYRIIMSFSDDGWIGGRANTISKKISVSQIGVVYSGTTGGLLGENDLLMLNHKDHSKQKVLSKIYEFLVEEKNEHFQRISWEKVGNLSKKYNFENCERLLMTHWMTCRKSLEIVSIHSEIIDDIINYTVTIKNNSDKGYYINKYSQTAPSKAKIQYSNGVVEDWVLLETHYGGHFNRLRTAQYFKPNSTTKLTQAIPIRNNASIEYSGFQVLNNSNIFFKWLIFGNDREFEGETYDLYPFRKMK